MAGELSAGVASIDITPPVGISMAGYYVRNGVSTGVERPLTATALVLANGQRKLAIVACDLIFLQSPHVDRVRAAIAQAIGAREGDVLINFSHTHCGPTPPSWGLHEPEARRAIQESYATNLEHALAGVADAANRGLAPARVGTGAGSCRIGINRREVDENGKFFLGENPTGPMDPEVRVIRVDRRDGSPLAIAFSYGCHTVTMGPKNLRLSPDYPGPARELVEKATGAKALFLQAAGGDINPVTGIGATGDDTGNMTRLGNILGAEAVKVAMEIRTHQRRGPRTFFASLSKNSIYPYLPVEDSGIELDSVSETFDLPLMPFPEIEEARRICEARKTNLKAARESGLPEHMLTVYHRFYDWSRKLLARVENGEKQGSLPVNFQAMRIGDLGIAAVSGETVVELGLLTKKASPFPKTLFLGYSNGCASYMPVEGCYPPEGWSPWETYAIPDMIFQTYQVPMALAPESGDLIVKHSVELLQRVGTNGALLSEA